MFRCTLTDRNGTADITDDVRNWDDIEATYKRDGYGGVVRSFTSKFEFAGDARKRLLSLFDDDYLSSSAKISLAVRDDDMAYRERFSCDMDFTTMEDDGVTLSMNAVDNDVAAIIKAKKGADYEYPVDVIKESETLEYDGIEINEQVKWQFVSNVSGGTSEADVIPLEASTSNRYTIPIYKVSEDVTIGNKTEFDDQQGRDDSSFFITAVNDTVIELEISIDAMVKSVSQFANNILYYVYGYVFTVYKFLDNGQTVMAAELKVDTHYGAYEQKNGYSRTFQTLRKGEKMQIKAILSCSNNGVYRYYTYNLLPTSYVKATWHNRLSQPVNIDVVKPSTLLNRLLKSMNGGNDGITGEIEPSERFGKAVLCAAESIRGIPQAKMYSSFTKFCEWMEAVFGYVYAIDGKTVRFMHRESCFENAVYKHVYEYSDYKLSVDEGLVFSHVNVGYDKQDYDSVNGRDEFNFTNQYTTGMLNTENSLDLISPYRADSFGIEFLAEKRGEDTTDSESDNDLFFAGVRLSGGKYLLDRTEAVEGVNSPSTIFNAMFSPSSMAEANRSYIGACTDKLSFASSDGNSEVTIGGRKENRDIATEGAIFSVKSVSFETPDTELPESLNGLVTLHHAGKDVTGFISDVDFRYTKRKAAEYTIMVKE